MLILLELCRREISGDTEVINGRCVGIQAAEK